ncbi:MAG: hypothetical protein GXY74_13430 [Phycisphaerae bacterium]|nr:hypothetical protein [Phycisphaerae bacterium]
MGYTIPLRNRPNGYPGLSADGDLVGNIIVRTGTAAQLSHVVLAPGEYAYAADTKKLVMGDGATIFADLSGIGTRSVVAVTDFIEVPGRDDMDIVFNVEVYGTPILMEPRRDGQRLTIIAGYAAVVANYGELFYVGDTVVQGYDTAVGGLYAYYQNYYPVTDPTAGAVIQLEATSRLLKNPGMPELPPLVWTVVGQMNLTTGEGY